MPVKKRQTKRDATIISLTERFVQATREKDEAESRLAGMMTELQELRQAVRHPGSYAPLVAAVAKERDAWRDLYNQRRAHVSRLELELQRERMRVCQLAHLPRWLQWATCRRPRVV